MWRETRARVPLTVTFVLSLGFVFGLSLYGAAIFADDRAELIIQYRHHALKSLSQLEPNWVERGGLELITGGPSQRDGESRWGHASLRFVGSGRTPLEDMVVEALGLPQVTDNLVQFAVHGIFGTYPLLLVFASTGELIQSYYFSEARGYGRTLLPSNRELRQRLVDRLKSLEQDEAPTEHYYYLSNNCMSFLARLLSQVGFSQLDEPLPFLPTQGSLHLKRSFLSPWPNVIGLEAREFDRLKDLGQRGDLTKASTLDLQRVLVFLSPALGARRVDVLEELGRRNDFQNAGRVYGVNLLPPAFYQRDQTPSPDEIHQHFSVEQMDQAVLFNRAAWNTNYTTSFCQQPQATAQCQYFARVRMLLEPLSSR